MFKNKTFIVYVSAFIFVIVNALFIIKENYFFNLFPLVLLIVFMALFSLEKLLYLIIFLTPLSISVSEFYPQVTNDVSLPVEPLLFGVLIIFIIKLIHSDSFDKRILYHPVSLAIYFNLFWIFITSISSTMPLVSFKFLLSRIWFLASYYFMATYLFKDLQKIYKYIWLYISSFLLVIFFTLYQHSKYGFFDQQAANFVVSPFLPDHTSYAAIIVMLIPFAIGFFSLLKKDTNYKMYKKIALSFAVLVLLVGLVFSYTRAAWVSLVGILLVYLVMRFRIKFKLIFLVGFTMLILFFSFQTQILLMLKKNNQGSGDNFTQHIESMSNISTDASNLERLNRWSCAYRMFKDKPILGFGPATYMFKYAPYQISTERTIISTNEGDVGNAHSEYLGPLSESGVLGFLSILLVMILTSYTALKIYSTNPHYKIRLLAMLMFLGLLSYYLHGALNNFLDLEKTSALFWGFTAVIVALDLYHRKEENINHEV